jgi:hypothetical protein
MSERLQVIATTVIVFLLGLGVGVWTQRMRPMPPPPIHLMEEFGVEGPPRFGPPGMNGPDRPGPPPLAPWLLGLGSGPPISPRQMRARIEALQPQVDAFRHKVDAIEDDFRTKLEAVLNPEQRSKLESLGAAVPPGPPPPPIPGCAGEMGDLFVPMVIYRPTLDRLGEVLHLNENQRDLLKKLLIERRAQMLALVDHTPPPSFNLGRILVQSAEGPPPEGP